MTVAELQRVRRYARQQFNRLDANFTHKGTYD